MRKWTAALRSHLVWCVWALAFGALTIGLGGVALAASDGGPGPDPNDPVVREQMAEGQARAAKWEAERNTPAAQAERQGSQLAFSGQSDTQALTTAQAQFPGWLNTPVYTQIPLASGMHVVRYLGDSQAQVAGPGEHRAAVFSTLPLIGLTPDGARAPVDLRLTDVAGGVSPRSTSAPVVLPTAASGAVRFPDKGFSVRVAGAQGAAERTHDRLFFANVNGQAADTDAMIQAARRGAEISFLLRSAKSAEDQVLAFDLPAGAHLELSGPAGQQLVTIMGADGKPLGVVMPPTAVDAQGAPVKASYSLSGPNRLVFHVAHREGSYKYPVLADPLVASWSPGMYSAWSWGTNAANFSSGADSSSFTYTQGPGTVGLGATNDFGRWLYNSLPGAYIYELYNYNVWHFFNNSEEFMGLNAADWTGQAGTWQDTVPSYGSGPGGGGGPNAGRYQAGGESYVSTVACAAGNAVSCSPPTHGTVGAGTMATTAGLMLLGPIGSGYIPKAAVYGAYLYESDDIVPTLDAPTHSGLPTGWVRSFSDTAGLASHVSTGLGLTRITLSGPGFGRSSWVSCSSYPCAFNQSASINYGSSDIGSDGTSTITAVATNAGGNQSSTRTWTVKLDRAAPTATESGEGWTTGTYTPNTIHTFNVNTTDTLSGVDHITIQDIDASGSIVSGHTQTMYRNKTGPSAGTTTCGAGSYGCPASSPNTTCDPTTAPNGCPLNTTYTLNTADPGWSAGKHTLRVTTYDFAGNITTPDSHDASVSAIPAPVERCSPGVGTSVFDGYVSSAYMHLQSQPGSGGSTLACAQVAASGVNQSLVFQVKGASASLGLPSVDSNGAACQTTSPNAVPGSHPLVSNTVLGSTTLFADAYSGPGQSGQEVWVCAGGLGLPALGDVQERMVIPFPLALGAPQVNPGVDQPAPNPPAPKPWPTGKASSACEAAGATSLVAANIAGADVWLSSVQSGSTAKVCVRQQDATGAKGGVLTLDTNPSNKIQVVANTSNDTTPCVVPIDHNNSPYLDIKTSAPGSNPATVCVDTGGFILTFKATTVGTTGSNPPIAIGYTPDN
ncbi:MAG: hypothetical protein QOI91_267 [Solirubrobacteraceae bacterium]|jgi:hypothetical protein|nr:hypothetical protein [Solirubrobacteraceae bacterium]